MYPLAQAVEKLKSKDLKKKTEPASKATHAQPERSSQGADAAKAQSPVSNAVSTAPATRKAAANPSSNTARPSNGILAQTKAEKRKRRPKNTVVVSMQMPSTLVKVLDDIVETGTYRSRSDLILQAVRSYPNVSNRLLKLEPKHLVQKK